MKLNRMPTGRTRFLAPPIRYSTKIGPKPPIQALSMTNNGTEISLVQVVEIYCSNLQVSSTAVPAGQVSICLWMAVSRPKKTLGLLFPEPNIIVPAVVVIKAMYLATDRHPHVNGPATTA